MMVYNPASDTEQQGLESVQHRAQFIDASSTHANMSCSLSLQSNHETNSQAWRFPLAPAEGSVAQQSAPNSLCKVNRLQR